MDSASTTARRTWLAILTLVVCAALWSLNGPLIKLLNAEGGGVSGTAIAFYRSAIGGIVFLPFALRRLSTLRNVSVGWPIGSVLTFTLMTICFVIATTHTAAANAIILQYTSPIWVFLLSPLLLKERSGRAEGAVLLVAMAGVATIFFGHPTGELPWLIVALGSGLGYGALTVTLRGLRRVNPALVASMNCLGSGVLLIPAVVGWGSFQLAGPQWALVLLLGLVQFALPYVMFSWALQYVKAHQAALIVLLETVLNPLWTFLIVGEPVPRPTLVGGPLILVGVVGWLLLTWRRGRPPVP